MGWAWPWVFWGGVRRFHDNIYNIFPTQPSLEKIANTHPTPRNQVPCTGRNAHMRDSTSQIPSTQPCLSRMGNMYTDCQKNELRQKCAPQPEPSWCRPFAACSAYAVVSDFGKEFLAPQDGRVISRQRRTLSIPLDVLSDG